MVEIKRVKVEESLGLKYAKNIPPYKYTGFNYDIQGTVKRIITW